MHLVLKRQGQVLCFQTSAPPDDEGDSDDVIEQPSPRRSCRAQGKPHSAERPESGSSVRLDSDSASSSSGPRPRLLPSPLTLPVRASKAKGCSCGKPYKAGGHSMPSALVSASKLELTERSHICALPVCCLKWLSWAALQTCLPSRWYHMLSVTPGAPGPAIL